MTLESLQRDIALAQIEFATLNRQHYRHRNAIGKFVRREYVALDSETERKIGELSETLCRLHRFHSILASKVLTERASASRNGA